MASHTIAVFGATGPTGIAFVRQALEAGHSIVALARSKSKLLGLLAPAVEETDSRINIIEGDALKREDIDRVFEDTRIDRVMITLGTHPSAAEPQLSICSIGTEHIIASLKKTLADTKSSHPDRKIRTITVTSLGVGDSIKHLGPLTYLFVTTFLRRAIADKNKQEDIIVKNASAELEYIICRPGGLRDKPKTGIYRAADFTAGGMITRGDVADFCVKSLDDSTWLNKTPCLFQ
ncbi:uncharacterized protein BJ171DRAFT_29426 [Polychytrium aggregatum]|uniref:uncharacterized protein n=1 Tax=Polychytrium aggregatum TaxID=110093 RepID=UPI0022FE7B96|nr:uncharacterized protein BJ171DRAFT_29426 [Polychytrium aggregatum]KAI9206382.1 hypothetical protein BJ171DRAFT_29426 [Polychytrium aggregatum]